MATVDGVAFAYWPARAFHKPAEGVAVAVACGGCFGGAVASGTDDDLGVVVVGGAGGGLP